MSKETFEQAMHNAIITERVTFGTVAGISHCTLAIQRKQGPNNLFSLVQNHVVLTPVEGSTTNEVDVMGSVTDVCIVVFGINAGYGESINNYTVESTARYLFNQYGFSFKNVCGVTHATLDLKEEHIERILGKDRAEVFKRMSMDENFTPNTHSVQPIIKAVTETFAFQETEHASTTMLYASAMDLVQRLPVQVEPGPYQGSIEVTGEPLDVCACIMMFMEMNDAMADNKRNVLERFKKEYHLDEQKILDHSHNLRRDSLADKFRNSSPFKEVLGMEPTVEELCYFPNADICTTGFDYACQVGDVATTRIGETTVILRGPKLKVCALVVVFAEFAKVDAAHANHLLAQLETKYDVDRKDIIRTMQLNYVTRRVPGVYRTYRENPELILRHFVQKAEEDVETELEKRTEAQYDEMKDLFIRLRDKDISLMEKGLLLEKLTKYATVPVLIMAMEKHLQDTDI